MFVQFLVYIKWVKVNWNKIGDSLVGIDWRHRFYRIVTHNIPFKAAFGAAFALGYDVFYCNLLVSDILKHYLIYCENCL
jgi:hypothetical protein